MSTPIRVPVTPLEKPPAMHQIVLEQLSNLIIDGSLAPGTRIVETELALDLGVSRGPVREALQALAREGFIDLRPHQGTFVHQPTEKEVRDFFEVRTALEAQSVGRAAELIQASQVRKLSSILDAGRAALSHGNDPSADHRRPDLHIEIAAISGNDLLTDLLRTMKRRADWYSPPFESQSRAQAWHEHQALVDAIVQHDGDRARRVAIAHVEASRDHYLSAFAAQTRQQL
ncbi:MAG: transcriptional regulator, GntR family [Rhodoglobus sp.]|nr:transcriptional regulator, GntR family [Rhodoglobus sp.]